MDDRVTDPVTPRIPVPPTPHASHDELLVVRYATGDLDPVEVAQARGLTTGCPTCSSLLSDIRAMSASARTELPVPRRTRDFTITADQARDLRDPGVVGRIRRAFSAPGGMLRPLAGATLSLGIALLVAGTVLPGPAANVGSSGSETNAQATTGAALAAPTDERVIAAAGTDASGGPASGGPAASGPRSDTGGEPPAASARQDQGAASAGASAGSDTGAPESSGEPFASAGPSSGLQAPLSVPGATGPTDPPNGPGDRGSEASPATGSTEHAPIAASEPTTLAAAGGREVTPAPQQAGQPQGTVPADSDDRRPILILTGLLLVLGAAVISLRSIARRA